MKNNQLLPFERNRYYAGKALTSTDFISEQLYMNNKRRFMNHVMYGAGVVCGLEIVALDDASILMESGAAIDGTGREIVVEASVVKKLSTIEGFEKIKGDKAVLCLGYKEENVQPIYCAQADSNDKEYEYNRINESYRLYLTEEEAEEENLCGSFFMEEMLLDHEDYVVTIKVPATVPKGRSVKLSCVVRKRSHAEKGLTFHALLQLPAFYDEYGAHEISIDIESTGLRQGGELEREYWINIDNVDLDETNLISTRDSMQITVGDESVEACRNINFKITLVNMTADELALKETGRYSLETRDNAEGMRAVRLARISMIRTETSYLISQIQEQGIRRYIPIPGDELVRNYYLSYFGSLRKNGVQCDAADRATVGNGSEMSGQTSYMASGRVEIPLEVNMRKGEVCYSEEIMHGLGKGNVYVDVGLEYLDDSVIAGRNDRNTIYGDASMFASPEYMNIQTAVKVMNDKGSFQIAAKLMGEQKSIVLRLSWVAFRLPSMKDAADMQEEDSRAIVPRTPTIRMQAKENTFIEVEFQNMPPSRLSYELIESGAGEIGADGIYTAPAREGVYEIHIYCTDMPKISTYVYVIVSK